MRLSLGMQVARLRRRITQFLRDRQGVSTVEYALITVAVVAIVGVAAAALTETFTELFDDLTEEITAAQEEIGDGGDGGDGGGADTGGADTGGAST